MTFRPALWTAALLAGLVAVPVLAQAQAAKTDGKYQIMKATEDRVWRLNTETGEIAVCQLDGANLVCTTTSDAAAVPKKSFEQLEAERKALEAAADKAAEERRQQDLKMMDRILEFIRELIRTALGDKPTS